MARIAIVSYWAPPQGAVASHRILRLSRALLGAGHEVHWVTLDRADLPQVDPTLEPLIPPEVKRHGLGGPCLITKPEAKGIVEKILRTIVYKLPQWFPVPDGYVEWTMRLKRELPAIVARERLDALFFCVGPHGAIMALPRLRGRLKDVKLYVDYRDLLSGNFWRESSSRRIREGLLRRERKALAAADALFVNTAAAKARFEEVVQTPPGFPVEVMRNAADYDLAEQVAAGVPAPDLGEGIHLGYFGTIFPLRRLRPVLEAMDALPDLPLKLHCFSPPNSMKLLDEDCAGLDVAVVKHDTVPYGQALRAMQAMDALVLVNGATKDDAIFVPGKLYDYLMARRPVLFVGEAGDAWNIVAATSGPEWCSRHSEPGKLRAALETLGKGAAPATNANGEYGPATTFQPLLRKLAGGPAGALPPPPPHNVQIPQHAMKILFLCHRFPFPPSGGAQIRAFHMIRHLSRNHEVVVGSMVRDEQEATEGRGLLDHCSRYYAGRVGKWMPLVRMGLTLPTATPASMGYFFSPDLKAWVDAELERTDYDLVLVYCSSMAPYVANAKGVPMILDFVDMDSQKWLMYAGTKAFPLSLGYRIEGQKLLRAEKAMARRFDICTTATPFETETLDAYGTGCRSATFGNGVDFEYFSPGEEAYDPDSIVFLGRMNYFPNSQCMIDFCADVLPMLLEQRPSTQLTIVGADPTPAVQRLADHPNVTVTGSVPDVRPYLRKAALSVAPLEIARGTQNKILESLATGVPCVCSRLAAGGVVAEDGEHLLACDTPEEYTAAILRLLNDPAERARFAKAGRARMLTHHNWDQSMARLDELVAEAVGRKPEAAVA